MYCILYNYTLLLKRQTTDNKGKSTTILFKQCLSSPHFCWGCFTLILNNDERWIKAQLCTVDWIRQHAGESSSIIKPSHYIDWDVCKTFMMLFCISCAGIWAFWQNVNISLGKFTLVQPQLILDCFDHQNTLRKKRWWGHTRLGNVGTWIFFFFFLIVAPQLKYRHNKGIFSFAALFQVTFLPRLWSGGKKGVMNKWNRDRETSWDYRLYSF